MAVVRRSPFGDCPTKRTSSSRGPSSLWTPKRTGRSALTLGTRAGGVEVVVVMRGYDVTLSNFNTTMSHGGPGGTRESALLGGWSSDARGARAVWE